MSSKSELEAMAKRILDGSRYMTIATVGEDGHPWARPVYFSPDEYRHILGDCDGALGVGQG